MRNYGGNYLYCSEAGNSEILVENSLFTFRLKRVFYSDLTNDPRHHQASLHTHPHAEVRFILKGKGEYSASKKRWLTVNAGEFVVFPAEMQHCIVHEEGCFCKFGFNYEITFKQCDGENVYALLNERLKEGRIYRYSHNAAILIDRILCLSNDPCFDYETALSFLVLSLFTDMMNTVAADLEQAKTTQDTRVRKAITFIENTISSNINARQVADHVDLSVKQLNRLFAAELGKTVNAVIEDVKCQKIRELLLDPKLSLADIVRIMGYNEVSTFSKAFKRAEGITPRQFRKNMRVDQI